ncbi:MarR family transcriptional regulator [Sulfuriferula nivalis]|uniref:MarR family transcriptional regulator n=2 Tax=Sulfuriferula nivalis TaxID=2675298 RepID=A0A809RHI0_9PROT|nr:MarR family transcriptional regulator [Sulfuriferula nivalis]
MKFNRPFLPLIRELARSFQAFEAYSSQDIRSMGLTGCQFDIIATLGNTAGMSFRELGEKTLITKGTLTGVVQRLEEKGLVQRNDAVHDGRSQIVQLTEVGEATFNDIFPHHLDYLDKVFSVLNIEEIQQMQATLQKIHSLFDKEAT